MALLTVCLAGDTMAQTTTANKSQSGPAVTIPLAPGTAINASLVGSIDSDRSKPGDPVSAVVMESVVYQRAVLLPKGSRIAGHVVRTGGDAEATAAIFVEFDRAILKNGQEAVLNAGIQALAAPATPATIPSREKYEENRMAGVSRQSISRDTNDSMVLPSTYTLPRRSVSDTPVQKLEGGLDRKGMFTPDSKGAFSEPELRVFTPMSEGSHGTVLVSKTGVKLDNGTRLLIVVQPPASSPDVR